MATKIASLAVEIGVETSKLEAGLKATKTQLQGVGDEAGKLQGKIGAFAGGFAKFAAVSGITALGAAFIETTKSAAELETTFGKIAALTDTPKSAIAGLRDEVLKLSTDIPVSANEMGKALYYISSSGFQGAEAMKILEMSSKAAAAGLGDTQVIADAVTSALNAYNLEGKDAARITDLLTFAVREGKGEPAELAGALGRVLPVAAAAGVSMEEVAASLAMMTRTGLSAEEGATSLRGTIGALLAPAKDSKEALAELGLTTDQLRQMLNVKEGGAGLVAVLDLLMQRTGGNIEMLDRIIPNIRALTGVLSSAGSQGEEYARVLGEAYKSMGLTEQAAKTMGDTMEAKLKKAQNSLDNLGMSITSKLLPGLGQAADAATTLINWDVKLYDAFTANEQKIRDSAKTYEEYSAATLGLGRAAGLVNDVFRSGQGMVTEYSAKFDMLTEAEWKLSKVSETTRVASRQLADTQMGMSAAANHATSALNQQARTLPDVADGMKQAAAQSGAAQSKMRTLADTAMGMAAAASKIEWSPIMTDKEKENWAKQQVKDLKALGEYYGGLTDRAISYTEAEKGRAELYEKLRKAEAEIAAAGTAHIGVIQKKTMSENEYAAAVAKAAKIQEDLASGARKKNETDAEYASRMANLQVQLDNVNASLGTQTGLIGGATEAQLKNRDAILEQIKALDAQSAKAQAMEGFKALEGALKEGKITTDQYIERTTMLNDKTKVYSTSALAAAQANVIWIQTLTNGASSTDQMTAAQARLNDILSGNISLTKLYYDELNKLPKDLLIQIRTELTGISIEELRDMKGLGERPVAAPAPKEKPTTAPARPGGVKAARGADFFVPPGYNENYPIYATSGERVQVTPRGEDSGGGVTNNTSISINIGAISKDYTPQRAGDEIVDRLRSRGIIA